MEYAEEVTINFINYRPLSEVTIITVTIMDITNSWILGVVFINIIIIIIIILLMFLPRTTPYVVINCLIELIRFIQHTSLQTLSFLQIPLKWPRYFPPVGARGASMGPQKPLCHRNLWWILYFIYLYTNRFQETNTPPPQKKKYRFKMEVNDLFCFASFQFRQKYEKTLFQRSFSMEFESWF